MATFSPDVIRSYVTQMLQSGKTYTDVANTAAQMGVPLDEIYAAFGLSGDQGAAMLKQQPLTQQEVQGANSVMNNQWGGTRDSTGVYQNYDKSGVGYIPGQSSSADRYMAGMTQAHGYGPEAIAQAFGMDLGAAQNFWNSQQGGRSLNDASVQYSMDRGFTNPSEFKNNIIMNGSGSGYRQGQGYTSPLRTSSAMSADRLNVNVNPSWLGRGTPNNINGRGYQNPATLPTPFNSYGGRYSAPVSGGQQNTRNQGSSGRDLNTLLNKNVGGSNQIGGGNHIFGRRGG